MNLRLQVKVECGDGHQMMFVGNFCAKSYLAQFSHIKTLVLRSVASSTAGPGAKSLATLSTSPLSTTAIPSSSLWLVGSLTAASRQGGMHSSGILLLFSDDGMSTCRAALLLLFLDSKHI